MYLKNFTLCLSLLSLNLIPIGLKAQYTEKSQANIDFERIIKIADKVDLLVEELSQGFNNVNFALKWWPKEEELKERIKNIRFTVSDFKEGKLIKLKEENLSIIIEILSKLVNHTEKFFAQGIELKEKFDAKEIIKNITSIESIDNEKINNIILPALELQLDEIRNNELKNFGFTKVNRIAKFLDELNTKNRLFKLGKRSIPYLGLGVYYTLVTKQEELPNWGWLQNLKQLIGGSQTEKASSHKIEKDIPKNGIIGTTLNKFTGFINFEHKPIYNFAIGGVMLPIIQNDLKDLNDWVSRNTSILFTEKAKGELFLDPYMIRESIVNFKKVMGQNHAKKELTKIIEYFKNKDQFDYATALPDKAYIFVGPLDISNYLGNALAKEVTMARRAMGQKPMYVTAIHASELVTKNIKDIVAEIERFDEPVVFIINELDWLTNRSVDTKVWTDIINTINKTAKSPKKDIVIISTVQDLAALNAATRGQSVGMVLNIEKFSSGNRKEFFEKEFEDHNLDMTKFDLQNIAYQTDGCSLLTLKAILKRAFSIAHAKQRAVIQEDFDQSINELVHNMLYEQKYTLKDIEKKILAAQFAGKALAHMILQPQSELLKVTILPINRSPKEYGSLVVYKKLKEPFITGEDIEKECKIELASIQAQQILLGNVSKDLANKTKQKVFDAIKSVVFEGVSEVNMPKALREEKLAEIWEIIEKYSNEIAAQISTQKDKLQKIAQALESKLIVSAKEINNL